MPEPHAFANIFAGTNSLSQNQADELISASPAIAGSYNSRHCQPYQSAMGHRLSKIYTRTGDTGTTGLGDGSRTGKNSLRIAALGDIDETNSVIGLLLSEALPSDVSGLLTGVQHDLFDLGGELSIPGAKMLAENSAARLETAIDRYNETLGPLKEFILPSGIRAAALAHLARTVCRRAERTIVTLAASEPVSPAGRQYLNRLSDLMFVLARHFNREAGRGDVLWQRDKIS